VLPGGAVLGARDREGDERAVACRPGAAVLESVRPLTLLERLRAAVKRVRGRLAGFWQWLGSREGIATVKRVLEVLVLLVGLITAILALFGVTRK
jgi:hypothetical protein